MADARLEHEWAMASEVLCLIDNRLRATGRPSTPADWNPLERARQAESKPVVRMKPAEAFKLWQKG